MYISRIQVDHFRNFEHVDVSIGRQAVFVGENAVGKTNLIYAIRLVLDPSLSESRRFLRVDDFWSGLTDPVKSGIEIKVAIEFSGLESHPKLKAVLQDGLTSLKPPYGARVTYCFRPKAASDAANRSISDYEPIVYLGKREDRPFNSTQRRALCLELLPALRDAEYDLSVWRRSPLRPLLERASDAVAKRDATELPAVAQAVKDASKKVTTLKEIGELQSLVSRRLAELGGDRFLGMTSLDIASTTPDRILRQLQLFFDGDWHRAVSEASIGAANLLYVALRWLHLADPSADADRLHTFLSIEEPEAHLHPHLQRVVYRELLRSSAEGANTPVSLLLTTHSPHVASVTPLRSLVLLRKEARATTASSLSGAELSEDELQDLQRYLDVTRAEVLFAQKVILVEGDAERFLIPAFAQLLGIDLDLLGITVCSVSGAHFGPYVAMLGQKGFQIPFTILTDGDPRGGKKPLFVNRVSTLLDSIRVDSGAKDIPTDAAALDEAKLRELAARHGIFVSGHTLEVDLVGTDEGCTAVAKAIEALTTNGAAKLRAQEMASKVKPPTSEQLLGDVEDIGKGRFAQYLSGTLATEMCPKYISDALQYIRGK